MNRPSNCLGTERASGTVKIYIAAHKHFDIDAQAPYQPLYVGASSIPTDNRQAGWLYDDQGDNISQKNNHYCELTGLYWIWKNSPESIVGLTHYRRAFESPNDSKQMLKDYEIENILTHYDCIVAAKEPCTSSIGCNLITVAEQYRMIHSSTDLLQAREIIRTKCPGYLDAFDKAICEECSFSPCNMFICKKELMDRYCKWLFKIEKQLEKRIDYISGRDSYQQRMPGFISERLFNAFLKKEGIKCYECHIFNPINKEALTIDQSTWPRRRPQLTCSCSTNAIFNGVDYSSVFDYSFYVNHYEDLFDRYKDDPLGALEHFIAIGINENRVAHPHYSIGSLLNGNPDLRSRCRANLEAAQMYIANPKEYMHPIGYENIHPQDEQSYSTMATWHERRITAARIRYQERIERLPVLD